MSTVAARKPSAQLLCQGRTFPPRSFFHCSFLAWFFSPAHAALSHLPFAHRYFQPSHAFSRVTRTYLALLISPGESEPLAPSGSLCEDLCFVEVLLEKDMELSDVCVERPLMVSLQVFLWGWQIAVFSKAWWALTGISPGPCNLWFKISGLLILFISEQSFPLKSLMAWKRIQNSDLSHPLLYLKHPGLPSNATVNIMFCWGVGIRSSLLRSADPQLPHGSLLVAGACVTKKHQVLPASAY